MSQNSFCAAPNLQHNIHHAIWKKFVKEKSLCTVTRRNLAGPAIQIVLPLLSLGTLLLTSITQLPSS
uniref:Uncharacterized protein n=1 Tax=Anguilla anguilla TaxID=7936 RepID=A0A0E9XEG9_ANGAN